MFGAGGDVAVFQNALINPIPVTVHAGLSVKSGLPLFADIPEMDLSYIATKKCIPLLWVLVSLC